MPNEEKQSVIIDQDGNTDDILSTALLLSCHSVNVLGIVVTPGDCIIEDSVEATRKLCDLMGKFDIPVAESTVKVAIRETTV